MHTGQGTDSNGFSDGPYTDSVGFSDDGSGTVTMGSSKMLFSSIALCVVSDVSMDEGL